MRVVIGEDEALMREGLSLVLAGGGIEVAALAADARELVRVVEDVRPDMVISDIRMPPGNVDDGLKAVLELRRSMRSLPVVVLSHYVQRQYAAELLHDGQGGVGYLLKHRVADLDRFVADLRLVASGGTVLDPEVVAAMVDRARRTEGPVEALTHRQRDVLSLIAEGRTNAAIARRLAISEKTVVQHISVIYGRLGVIDNGDDHRRVLAVLRFLSDGVGGAGVGDLGPGSPT
jgi:DNA-binding NarL/FixJ family response regulator